MKIKCDYCGALVDETNKICSSCGAPLSGGHRTSKEQPKTIEELKKWYVDHHLPPEEITRFFIGKNVTEPKAFGIYKDGSGNFVVYKNKSTGERAVRYKGADEQYAVNELYQRLKAEIVDQKANRASRSANYQQAIADKPKKKKKKKGRGCLIALIVFFLLSILVAIFDNSAPNGYYNYNGKSYYHQGSSWYYYDANTDDWYKSDESSQLDEWITDDNAKEYQYSNHTGKTFESTNWYDAGHTNNDSHWDSDYDWGSSNDSYDSDWGSSSGGWDSGSSDWDSDW